MTSMSWLPFHANVNDVILTGLQLSHGCNKTTQLFWRAETADVMTGYAVQGAVCDGQGTVGPQTVLWGFKTCLSTQNSCHSSGQKESKAIQYESSHLFSGWRPVGKMWHSADWSKFCLKNQPVCGYLFIYNSPMPCLMLQRIWDGIWTLKVCLSPKQVQLLFRLTTKWNPWNQVPCSRDTALVFPVRAGPLCIPWWGHPLAPEHLCLQCYVLT